MKNYANIEKIADTLERIAFYLRYKSGLAVPGIDFTEGDEAIVFCHDEATKPYEAFEVLYDVPSPWSFDTGIKFHAVSYIDFDGSNGLAAFSSYDDYLSFRSAESVSAVRYLGLIPYYQDRWIPLQDGFTDFEGNPVILDRDDSFDDLPF